ncbi:MAG: helix-turn-helix domain-containing protein [Thermoanaerobaculia bacterium]
MRRIGAPDDFSRIPAEPEFLSRGEVARLFGVSLSTVTRWARTSLLQTVRTPGGHYRYRAEEMRRAARSGVGAITNVD